jgi:phosphoglycerate dehydrogenase-like enzyme
MAESPRVVAVTSGSAVAMPDLAEVAGLARLTVVDGDAPEWPDVSDAEVAYLWDYRYGDMPRLRAAAPRLRWIQVAAVGVDAVLTPDVVASDLVVTNSRGVFDRPIAEYVLALLLAAARGLRETYALQDRRVWKHRTTGTVAGRRVAVVGTGSIGRSIARLLAAVGARVELVGTRRRDDAEFGPVAAAAELTEVAAHSDVLVLAAPATEANRGMVGREVLTALGPAGYLVNIGRGSLVVEPELVDALASGALGGATLDVFAVEPLPAGSPLWTLPGVVVSPHMSADAGGFADDLVGVLAGNLRRWAAGEPLRNVVDKELGYVPTGE